MNTYQGRFFQVLIASMILALGLHAYAAKKYIVKYNSPVEFQQMKQSFYEAPIHGLNNANDGTFDLMNSEGVVVEEVLAHLEMVVVVVKDKASEEALKNSSLFSSVVADVMLPSPSPIGTFSKSKKATRMSFKSMDLTWGIKAVKAQKAWDYARGEGANVLVVDTGVDKDHMDLAKRFKSGKNFLPRRDSSKVPYDFFDDIGHGTHVAGTVLAGGRKDGLRGVAPKAGLYAARVCGSLGCSTIAITRAINWGVEQKVDVINLSLGGPFPTNSKFIYESAVAKGVTIVAASGNEASAPKYKPGFVSYPAAYDATIAVGAMTSEFRRAVFSQYGDKLTIVAPGTNVLSSVPLGSGRKSVVELTSKSGTDVIESKAFQGSLDNERRIEGELVHVGLGKPEAFKGIDLKGKFALIARGEITFEAKVREALKYGATGVLIYNNKDGITNGTLTQDGSQVPIPVAMIAQTKGLSLVERLEKGEVVSVSVMVERTDFSSYEGTSMAAPHVTGVVALLKSVNPNFSPEEIRDIITSTAKNLGNKFETGSGLINAHHAVLEGLSRKAAFSRSN